MEMDRTSLVKMLTSAAERDSRIVGLLLTGSLGAGRGDAWSDVDTVLVTTPQTHADVVASARDWVAAIAPPVLWRQLYPPHPLFHAVLPGWLRLDITITIPDQIPTVRSASTPLYDPSNLHARLPERLLDRQPDPGKIEQIVEEFLRIMLVDQCLVVLSLIAFAHPSGEFEFVRLYLPLITDSESGNRPIHEFGHERHDQARIDTA